jgi:hypothetical protein
MDAAARPYRVNRRAGGQHHACRSVAQRFHSLRMHCRMEIPFTIRRVPCRLSAFIRPRARCRARRRFAVNDTARRVRFVFRRLLRVCCFSLRPAWSCSVRLSSYLTRTRPLHPRFPSPAFSDHFSSTRSKNAGILQPPRATRARRPAPGARRPGARRDVSYPMVRSRARNIHFRSTDFSAAGWTATTDGIHARHASRIPLASRCAL